MLVGLAAGLGGGVAMATALRSLRFGISPLNPISPASVLLVLLATSLLAC